MTLRERKALEIAARCRIVFADGAWLVPSPSGATNQRVTFDPDARCTCEDFLLRGQPDLPCKHILAVQLACERDGLTAAPALDSETIPLRPNYPRNWPAYNLAQTTEKRRLQVLLADLCRGLPPRQRPP